jgi:F420-dependent methylenetetrahydromethanopterin dehydrogenase
MAMTDLDSDRLGTTGDVFYAALLKAHEGLSPEDSARFNARLVLILANQVGDRNVLQAALDKATERFPS